MQTAEDEAKIADLERRLAESERAAAALRDDARLYRSLFGGITTAVTVRSLEDQSFIDCNPAAVKLYRAGSVERFRGCRITDLSADVQPDGRPSAEAAREHVRRAIASGSDVCEWLARRFDGTLFLGEFRIAVLNLEGGRRVMQTIIVDVTDRKAAEAARAEAERRLRASEERYRALVERSHDAILVFDLQANVTFASPAAERMFGRPGSDLVGRPALDLLAPEDHGRLLEGVAAGRVGRAQPPEEWTVMRGDGDALRVEAVRSPMVDHDGAVTGALVIARDVSERHRADVMRREAEAQLARAKEDAVAASAAKSAFVANMSHELRTPLNGVIGMVDLLSRTPLESRQKRYVDVARASASLLLSVINDILDFSKIEAGKLELERVDFSLREVIEEVTTMLALSAEEKGLELSCDTDAALEGSISGDPSRVRQVLVNLMSNAIKFTARGEIAVRARAERTATGPRVRVEVRDTGVGISREAQAKLFLPFSQIDASTTRKYGGTGLGLAICRELVHRMGGAIGVDSRPGQGSTFWFTLRLDSHRVSGRPAAGPRRDTRLAGLRVLAVDDHATNREILKAQLTAAGMRCDVAASGAEALSRLGAAAREGDPYTLAILDQHMPEMDGPELARRIRADASLAATRLMVLASMARPLDGAELQALGIAAWATKPLWRAQLLRALGSALEGHPASSGVLRAAAPVEDLSTPPGPRHLLLVEDTPINAEVVVEILSTAGLSVDVVDDGLQAVEAVRRGRYDLVLMDCQVPGIDGYEATRRIRAMEATGGLQGRGRGAPLPILALTASATREDLERARLAGMDDHVSKPVDARRLLAAIVAHLGPAGQGPEPAHDDDGDGAPAVDLAKALDRIQGNRPLLDRIVAQFVETAGSAPSRLREGLARRDAEPLGFAVHKLRGLALAIDATPLAAALGTLESRVAREEWTASEAAMPAVESALEETLAALEPPS